MQYSNNEKGFTMIEIAIVLIIIGIIIGAVVKGKDLISSAEQKKIYTKFISAWQNAYLTFYDRTGKILGDTYDGTAIGQDGWADTTGGDGSAISAADRADLCNNTKAGFYGLTQVGIECPVTNTGNSYSYNYKDSNGNTQVLTIAFRNENGTNKYNYMELTNMTTELAMAMDTLIDGEADGTAGDFLNANGTTDWGTTPTAIITARWRMQF